jgi:hypothetical protein
MAVAKFEVPFLGGSEEYREGLSIFGLQIEIVSLGLTNTVFGAKKFCRNMK